MPGEGAQRSRGTQLRALADAALALNPVMPIGDILASVTNLAREIVGARAARTNYVGSDAAHTPLTAESLEAGTGGDRVPERSVTAPLIARDGVEVGRIELADKTGGGEFDDDDAAILVQLAQMASVAIDSSLLIERERAARAEAEDNARIRGLLSDASRAFAASLDVSETLETLASLLVPDFADLVSVHLVTPDERLDQALLRHVDPQQEEVLRSLSVRYPPRLDAPIGAAHAIRSGATQMVSDIPDELLVEGAGGDPELLGVLRGIGMRSGIAVPLVARGRTVGALTLVRQSGAGYTERERTLAEDLASRAAVAIDTATRYALERDVAAALQRSLLPQALPVVTSLTAAARYLPGASGTHVGGDWYDLIEVTDGRLALVVGDVMGHGVAAAAVMGQLRAAVRAYAIEGHSPAELLDRLDQVVQALGDVQLTTCLYAVYDPVGHTLCMASAGHLPPLVITPQGPPYFVDVAPGPPLGVGGSTYDDASIDLPVGTTVLLYTDGLVEGRGQPIDDGLAALRRAAASRPVHSPDELCDRVLAALRRADEQDDDTALLAITVMPARVGVDPVRLELPPRTQSVAAARAFVGERLASLADAGARETSVLLVSELVTNAVRHARTAVGIDVALDAGVVRVGVRDESAEPPTLRPGLGAADESGRGIHLVEALADRWGWEHVPRGKRVWFELAVNGAAST
ncbi:MAG: SpoIIE family protein phosphatase [Mycobacteriales bacterium]